MRISRFILSFIIVTLLITITVHTSNATPRFSARYKQNCQLCHINPAGGGMRTTYGAQFFSYMDLPMKPLKNLEELDSFDPRLSEKVQAGVDFRSIYWYVTGDTLKNSVYRKPSDIRHNQFLTMQSDLYLAITPTDKSLIYIEKGIHNSFEAFVQLRGIGGEGTIKVGRFIPAYGWRFADHKAFVRDYLGFSQYPIRSAKLIEDSGIEFGYWRMAWEASVAITNGSIGLIDNNEGKAVTARIARRLSIGDVDLTFGGSYRYGEIGENSSGFDVRRYAGAFWGVNYNRFVYVGEADRILQNGITNQVSTHVGSLRLLPGLALTLILDFYDEDIYDRAAYDDDDDGFYQRENIAYRQKLALEFYPTGYLEITPAIELNRDEFRGFESITSEIQFHVWF